MRSLAVTGVKNGIVIGDRPGDLKANWRQVWQDIVAEARNVRNEDIKNGCPRRQPGQITGYFT
ncbi:hypothetical protein [Neomoorella thermoacetica]|uniref:hypothetical protein n=1 Tax=Neomoorella thermoacetica TaxID=1525 RepID=UPI00130DF35D|nr:hypothetical protein [Moorella thermoacetica]